MPDDPEVEPPAGEQLVEHPAVSALEKLRTNLGETSDAVDEVSNADMKTMLGLLQTEVREKKIVMNVQQLEALKTSVNAEAQENIAERGLAENIASLELRGLEVELQALRQLIGEQERSPAPQWVQNIQTSLGLGWAAFRLRSGETIDWIGGFFGARLQNIQDVWAASKRFLLGAIAGSGMVSEFPVVQQWVNGKLERENVSNGIRQAVSDISKTSNVTFIDTFTETEWLSFSQVLKRYAGSNLDLRLAAMQYVTQFVANEKNKPGTDPTRQIPITLEALTLANLSSALPANAPAAGAEQQRVFGIEGLAANVEFPLNREATIANLTLCRGGKLDEMTHNGVSYRITVAGVPATQLSIKATDPLNQSATLIRVNNGVENSVTTIVNTLAGANPELPPVKFERIVS